MVRLSVIAAAWITACSAAIGAPAPQLAQEAGLICSVRGKPVAGQWQPSPAQIFVLERSLPDYFARLPDGPAKLPAPGVVYARQYSGIVIQERKVIHGRFYPASDPAPRFAKPGECWNGLDGGPRYWDVFFDPKAGRVISHQVNGLS